LTVSPSGVLAAPPRGTYDNRTWPVL